MTTRDLVTAAMRRYDFAAWGGRTVRSDSRVFVWNYRPSEGSIPGWDLFKLTRWAPPARAGLEASGAVPFGLPVGDHTLLQVESPDELSALGPRISHTRMFWRPAELPEVALEAELYEAPSAIAAHVWLIWVVASMQFPLLERVEAPEWGDVCFAGPTPTALIFARGNLVANLRNAGRQVAPVYEVASGVDRDLTTRPRGSRGRRTAEASARYAKLGERVELGISGAELEPGAADASRPSATLKIFYSGGDIEADEGGLHLRIAEAGQHRVHIFRAGAEEPPRLRELLIEVQPQ